MLAVEGIGEEVGEGLRILDETAAGGEWLVLGARCDLGCSSSRIQTPRLRVRVRYACRL